MKFNKKVLNYKIWLMELDLFWLLYKQLISFYLYRKINIENNSIYAKLQSNKNSQLLENMLRDNDSISLFFFYSNIILSCDIMKIKKIIFMLHFHDFFFFFFGCPSVFRTPTVYFGWLWYSMDLLPEELLPLNEFIGTLPKDPLSGSSPPRPEAIQRLRLHWTLSIDHWR